ncbi:MAG: DnaA regulatory inactivator Hda [Neisseria sp.]|nr:DnaA regulatory inactivator Hda [Neisseria sp.]
MNQLIFDFATQQYPGFDKFLGQSNGELLYMLQRQQEQFVYVWGTSGCGKSHLLQAWVAQALDNGGRACYVDAGGMPLDEQALEYDYLAVDQVDKLSPFEQALLFEIFNNFRNSGQGKLLLAASEPPYHLNMREDLRTRFGYCLVYEIKPLSDEEKIAALDSMVAARNINVDKDIFPYLIRHWRRDMDSLVQMLDTLCNYAAVTRRSRITLPFLRQLLKEQHSEQEELG